VQEQQQRLVWLQELRHWRWLPVGRVQKREQLFRLQALRQELHGQHAKHGYH